jgi:putative lipoprotein (rSAM/lipoprotein system)
MKKNIIKFFDKIIVLLLGFTGMFTACKQEFDCSANYFTDVNTYQPSDSIGWVEYGPLPVDFEIRGKVTNKASSQPISGIRIIHEKFGNIKNDTIYTDSEGKYTYRLIGNLPYYAEGPVCHLIFEDIDGEENGGKFATKEEDVTFTSKDKAESCDGWSVRYEKTQNIKLEKEK